MEDMVLPRARDHEEFGCQADLLESGLGENTARRDVVHQRLRLDAMQADVVERELHAWFDGNGGHAAARPLLSHPEPERTELYGTSNHAGEGELTDRCSVIDDQEGVRPVLGSIGLGPLKARSLPGCGEPFVRTDRPPRRKVASFVSKQRS
ncbi:hypothetical protein CJ228_008080 [Micrococcus lylae]|nr:hypothetical protein [Micrococcus lylae]WIK81563.1 hypothetical protein CJ228_008080 [Micrococcus lylae]